MKFIKKYIYIAIISVVLLLAVRVGANAARTLYVNDGMSTLDGQITDAYAVGADGVAQIDAGRAYALTADGLKPLDDETDVYLGGGGLLYDDGSVKVATGTVKVGLYYYYSKNRDSSLEVAHLENAVGSGYAFGYFDDNRNFVQAGENAVTDATQIYMQPLGEDGTGVGVYARETNELLWSAESTGKNNYFAVHPLCDDGEALTWFKARRYYGDFGYANLGNGKLTVMNVVPLERYLVGVLAQEMGDGFPTEALKAQAVAARTYAMYQIHNGGYTNSCGFDMTNDEYSQAYIGYYNSDKLRGAARDTENQYLTYNGALIQALYAAADGGETLDSEAVYGNVIPYLRGVKDPYEAKVWTKGVYGHQLGMSQRGAQAMAQYYNKTYKDILGFYYTKVGISYGHL